MTPTSPLIITDHAESKVRRHAHKDQDHFGLKLPGDGFYFPTSSSLANTTIKLLSPHVGSLIALLQRSVLRGVVDGRRSDPS